MAAHRFRASHSSYKQTFALVRTGLAISHLPQKSPILFQRMEVPQRCGTVIVNLLQREERRFREQSLAPLLRHPIDTLEADGDSLSTMGFIANAVCPLSCVNYPPPSPSPVNMSLIYHRCPFHHLVISFHVHLTSDDVTFRKKTLLDFLANLAPIACVISTLHSLVSTPSSVKTLMALSMPTQVTGWCNIPKLPGDQIH